MTLSAGLGDSKALRYGKPPAPGLMQVVGIHPEQTSKLRPLIWGQGRDLFVNPDRKLQPQGGFTNAIIWSWW